MNVTLERLETIEATIDWFHSEIVSRDELRDLVTAAKAKAIRNEIEPTEVRDRLKTAHGLMLQAFETLAEVRGRAGALSADVAFACGEALGVISRAKALVRRDIDERSK
jgi:hypothetical protein